MTEDIIKEIEQLKEEKNAIILAHNYQPKEIQDIADFMGDSLGLCIKASEEKDADIIVFCGVNFMAETAYIINPEKKVLLPDFMAGCPMADMLTQEELQKAKKEHPDSSIVLYVNSRAKSKSEADIVCTSANAGKVVGSLDTDSYIFGPDYNLGHYANKDNNKEVTIVPKDGHCFVHKMFKPEDIIKAREKYPDAKIVVHPECNKDVQDLADYVESTGGMMKLGKDPEIKQLLLGTEVDMVTRLEKEFPTKEFLPLREDAICDSMKLFTLEKVRDALKEEKYEVTVDKEIADKARVSIQRMLDLE